MATVVERLQLAADQQEPGWLLSHADARSGRDVEVRCAELRGIEAGQEPHPVKRSCQVG
jgi:hypothetical protein